MRKNNRAARAARTKYNFACTTEREKFAEVDKSTKKSASNITITICVGED